MTWMKVASSFRLSIPQRISGFANSSGATPQPELQGLRIAQANSATKGDR